MDPFQDAITRRRQEGSPSTAARYPSESQVAVELAALQRHATLAQMDFTSHRKVLGQVVISIKKGLRRLLTPILERQTAYNAANTRLVSYLCAQMEVLRQECLLVQEEVNKLRPRQVEAVQTRGPELTGQLQYVEGQPAPKGDDIIQPRVQTPYEAGWDTYCESWESSVKHPGMSHLGDEWGTPQLTEAIMHQYVKPHLQADAVALEIGSGWGKYSEKLAPLCKVLICADVSGKMIEGAKRRLHRFTNIQFEKLNGLDLRQFASESIDYIFSFDCFVHIEIEDIYCYLQEMKRVLTPGGRGLLHFANLNSAEGWDKFITEAPTNRGHPKHFDRFCFLTWEIVEKFFSSLELEIVASQREPWRDILVVFQKGADEYNRASSPQTPDCARHPSSSPKMTKTQDVLASFGRWR
jgi:ubiquinone/menaquinone biosynthesis C-methylase UbiE